MASILSQLLNVIDDYESPKRPGFMVFIDGDAQEPDFDDIDFDRFDESQFVEHLQNGNELYVQWSPSCEDDDFVSPPIQIFLEQTTPLDIQITFTGEEFNEVYTAIKDVHDAMTSGVKTTMDNADLEQLAHIENILRKLGEDV